MTEVVISGQHRYAQSMGLPPATTNTAAPKFEMTPNPDFSFPRLPPPAQNSPTPSTRSRHGRPLSLNMSGPQPWDAQSSHTQTASTLPSFSFNAHDATGHQDARVMAHQSEGSSLATPSRGHRRQNSEFVGGVGMTAAISSSPTRTAAMPLPPAPTRHRHVRSFAASSHDLSKIMAAPEPQPRLSSSLPSTPLEHPMQSSEATDQSNRTPEKSSSFYDPFGPPLEPVSTRPPSSRGRQVGFSDNVEYIPRPLSTISSETESSLSTIRGHSVNNSITSVLSLSTPSPPSFRARTISLEPTLEDEPKAGPRSSLEIGKRAEKEANWLRQRSAGSDLRRPSTEPAPGHSKLSFALNDGPTGPVKAGLAHRKMHSVGRSLGFDRRKSEPAIGMLSGQPSRLSALSLQEPSLSAEPHKTNDASTDRRSSTRKFKDWAASKMSRKQRSKSEVVAAAPNENYEDVVPVAETNLDAVFSNDTDADIVQDLSMSSHTQLPTHSPLLHHQSSFSQHDSEDSEDGVPMLDLDAALGPFNTPAPLGPQKPQRKLHSDRRTLDFVGPGLHYQPLHERTLSAPILMPFEQTRTSTPPQNLEVFDEEDEHEANGSRLLRSSSAQSGKHEGTLGVSVVDEDTSSPQASRHMTDEGLGIARAEWDLQQPVASHSMGSRLATPLVERRSSSLIEQTIIEEASPVDSVAIDPEESRAQSLTKSSDSSEAPTIVASQTMLALPDGQHNHTPDTFNSSEFSSPDLARRQSSFDTSRVGTSTSSITDNRTVSSCTTGEPMQETRSSVDDTPSLTSSRSTMISTVNASSSRRDFSGARTPSVASGRWEAMNAINTSDRRRKRATIQSLSQLVGAPFGSRPHDADGMRPQTAANSAAMAVPKKKEHRLKKLMFWKHRQVSTSTIV